MSRQISLIRGLKILRCKMLLFHKKNIKLGYNSTFGRGTVFFAPNHISIADNVYIGKYCSLETDIEIGEGVVIGNNVGMVGKYDHDYSFVGKMIKDAPWIGEDTYRFKGRGLQIIIEGDVWIGFGSVLLSGVKIGRGAIVAAGSVVTKDVTPYSIVAGNPAVQIAERYTQEEIVQHESILYSARQKNI